VEREREQTPDFATARPQHPAIESAINRLEHHGLQRIRSFGADGFSRRVDLSIIAAHRVRVGRLLRDKERARLERQHRRRAAWSLGQKKSAENRRAESVSSNRATPRSLISCRNNQYYAGCHAKYPINRRFCTTEIRPKVLPFTKNRGFLTDTKYEFGRFWYDDGGPVQRSALSEGIKRRQRVNVSSMHPPSTR